MSSLTPFQEMMVSFYTAVNGPNKAHFTRGLEFLDSDTMDPYQFENQLLKELWVRRWPLDEMLQIYEVLVRRHKYVMCTRDLQNLVKAVQS